ncbi:hypothetical protein J27TS7_11600 [Paenibacillus dendritiformis]|nr:hypothetical protein J27TS7_11600 [Paenibacillus dendritiformis]
MASRQQRCRYGTGWGEGPRRAKASDKASRASGTANPREAQIIDGADCCFTASAAYARLAAQIQGLVLSVAYYVPPCCLRYMLGETPSAFLNTLLKYFSSW